MFNKRASVLLTTLVLMVTLFGCDGGEDLKYLRDLAQERVDKDYSLGISVGIIEDGEMYTFSFGKTNKNKNMPVTLYTKFLIASISKTMTGTMLSKQIDENLMSIEDTVSMHLFDEISAMDQDIASSITLKQLVTHTSGLPTSPSYVTRLEEGPYTVDQFFDYMNSVSVDEISPGNEYQYSNVATSLLGYILQHKKNKQTFQELLNSELFYKLAMVNTNIVVNPNNPLVSRRYDGDVQSDPIDLNHIAPAGGIYSNTKDMMKYLALHMGMLEKYPTYKSLSRAAKATHATVDINNYYEMGMSWFKLRLEDCTIVYHPGGVSGYASFLGFTDDYSKGIIILTSSNFPVFDMGLHYLSGGIVPTATIYDSMDMTTEEMDEYTGTYVIAVPGFSPVFIIKKDDKLYMQMKPVNATMYTDYRLFKKGDDSFFIKLGDITLDFQRNAGTIAHFLYTQNGYTVPLPFMKTE